MTTRHVLAIDQGTTGTKALVVTGEGRVAGSQARKFRQFYPRPGWAGGSPPGAGT